MKRVVFLESNVSGSGFQALQIAKQEDFHVTFLTRNLQHYLKVPGAQDYFRLYVDDILTCETNDVEAVWAMLRERSQDALISIGEYHVPIAAEVSKRLGLLGLLPQAAQLARNKLWTREHCLQRGIPAPRFASAANLQEARAAATDIGFPCVIKPADESASVDVILCTSLEQLEHHFTRIKQTEQNSRGQQRFPRLLIEQYLLGYEVSVETISWQGETHVIGVTDKQLSSVPYFVEMGHTFPSLLPTYVQKSCAELATSALEAIGFDFGAAHVELKVTQEGPKLIEINPRPAGDRIPDLIEYSFGIPFLKNVVLMHLGIAPQLLPSQHKGAAIRFLPTSEGTIERIDGQDLARLVQGVSEVSVAARKGSTISHAHKNGDRAGHVIAVAEHASVAGYLADAALRQISIAVL